MAKKIRADKDEFTQVYQQYTDMKSERSQYTGIWEDIAKYAGIGVDPEYIYSGQGNKSAVFDQFVDDPTAFTSINQQADYMVGILWGTGDKALDVIPSRYVLELADQRTVEDYFDYVTEQTLYHVNHPDAGFHTALQPYAFDQAAFGTSGVGAFPNQRFIEKIEDNALFFRQYGIDNTCIDEGRNGQIDTTGTVYHWKINRIIQEFCMSNGKVDMSAVGLLPKALQDAYKNNDNTTEYDLIFLVRPRLDYNPRFQGVRGTRFCGYWFQDQNSGEGFFHEESFHEKPIAMCRQIKIRGETYGRSSGTMLLSSIRASNFIWGTVMEVLEKMTNPALGMWNSAIFGDQVLDDSANGLTIFNPSVGGKDNPIFPLYNVQDPSKLVEILLPMLKTNITTGFHIDVLLDMNSAQEMSATEALQRYTIRGKSLAGMLMRQKTEMLSPTMRRCISVLDNLGELGIDPNINPDSVKNMRSPAQKRRVIPQAVLDVKRSGRPWYELRFNNELEKLTRTQEVQNLLQELQIITAMAAIHPDIVQAVDWYKFLETINNNLDYNNQILIGADDFKKQVAAAAQAKAAAFALQAGQGAASIGKDNATANKTNVEAQNARGPTPNVP